MKRIVSVLLCILTMAAGLCVTPAGAVDTNMTLRVGLLAQGALDSPQLENVSGFAGGYAFGTMEGTTFSPVKSVGNTQLTMRVVNGAVQAADTATGEVLFTAPAGSELAVQPNSGQTWFKGYKWKGSFVYRITDGSKLVVINYVPLEEYVKGVLPYEVDPNWPAEALKAQAVCARSFALGTRKHTSEGFDLCNTTNCQVYLGTNKATAASDAAVEATAGEYLTYAGEPVVGYFFSSDGGATEDAANVWGGDYAYLKGKVDPYEEKVDEWSVTLTAEEIRAKLLDGGYQIGTVSNVQVTRRTATDNVNEVTVTDTEGKQVTIRQSAVRTVFGLKSIRYTITPNTGTGAPLATSLAIVPSVHQVTVDGSTAAPRGYNIGGNNYYKLRDIAYILTDTESRFNVTWDSVNNRIVLTPGEAYQPVGGELAAADAVQSYIASDAEIVMDGSVVPLTGYRINNNNYYKLRDIGEALGFGVDFADQTVLIRTGKSSEEPDTVPPAADETPAPSEPVVSVTGAASYTFHGKGWGHSVGMSQWGAYAMAKQGFGYQDILKFYYTGIAVSR